MKRIENIGGEKWSSIYLFSLLWILSSFTNSSTCFKNYKACIPNTKNISFLFCISGIHLSNKASAFISYEDLTYSYWDDSSYSKFLPGSPVANQNFLIFIVC